MKMWMFCTSISMWICIKAGRKTSGDYPPNFYWLCRILSCSEYSEYNNYNNDNDNNNNNDGVDFAPLFQTLKALKTCIHSFTLLSYSVIVTDRGVAASRHLWTFWPSTGLSYAFTHQWWYTGGREGEVPCSRTQWHLAVGGQGVNPPTLYSSAAAEGPSLQLLQTLWALHFVCLCKWVNSKSRLNHAIIQKCRKMFRLIDQFIVITSN